MKSLTRKEMMKNKINFILLGALLMVMAIPCASATIKYIDGFEWYYYSNAHYVHSEYNHYLSHSASVTARGEKIYRASTNEPYLITGITLHTDAGGKKAYYNYW